MSSWSVWTLWRGSLSEKELLLSSQVSAMLVFADLRNELGDEGAAQSAESSLAPVHPGSIHSTGHGSVCLHLQCWGGQQRESEVRGHPLLRSELGLCLRMYPGLPEILDQKDEKEKEDWNSYLLL